MGIVEAHPVYPTNLQHAQMVEHHKRRTCFRDLSAPNYFFEFSYRNNNYLRSFVDLAWLTLWFRYILTIIGDEDVSCNTSLLNH